MKRFFVAAVALAALLVAGCLLPQRFQAGLTISSDGAYAFTYEGTALYLVTREERNNGQLSDEDEKKGVAELVEMLEGEDDVVSVVYEGNDIYKLSLAVDGNVRDDAMTILGERNVFSFSKDNKEKTCTFAFLEKGPDEEPDEEAVELFKSMQGTITVTTALPVEKAEGNPAVSDDGKTYTWTVSGIEGDMPKLVMRFE